MTKNFRKTLGATLLGLAAVCSAPTASAAIITGSWDPVLPAPFVDLGWVATVNLNIANDCVLDRAGGFSTSIFGRSFGCALTPERRNFSVLSAQVGLYSTITGRLVDVLTFMPRGNSIGVNIDPIAGSVANFLLTLDQSEAVSSTRLGDFNTRFKLSVPGTLPALFYQNPSAPGAFIRATGDPIVTGFAVNPDSAMANVLSSTALSVGQRVVAVPEPGSMALVLLALGAEGAVASRRSRRVHHTT